jgi:dTDP-4-amino-4,6-dideoxygalactose transaminase
MKLINDLTRHTTALRGDIDAAVHAVLDTGHFILGGHVTRFEEAFAAACGVPHCVSVGNGTDALELGLRAAGVRRGTEVVTVANAGFYSTAALLAIGAIPVFADIDPVTGLIALDSLAECCDRYRPGAIVVTHLYGRMPDMAAVCRIARDRGLALLEDCAQAHGGHIAGRRAGSWGDVGCFSFYPTKNLGGCGDGGAIVCQAAELADRVRRLRQYGWESKYRAVEAGGRNSRLDDIQAAILLRFLPYLDDWNERRREIAAAYDRGLTGSPCGPLSGRGSDYVAHLYVVTVGDRDALRSYLQGRGIGADVHYPVPDHLQPAAAGLCRWHDLRQTERLSAHVLTLPCYPELTDAEVAVIVETIRGWQP